MLLICFNCAICDAALRQGAIFHVPLKQPFWSFCKQRLIFDISRCDNIHNFAVLLFNTHVEMMKTITFIVVSFILLTANFRWNMVNSVNPELFNNFQIDSESLVVGRLLLSQNEGLSAHNGFLGLLHPKTDNENTNIYSWQYSAYTNNLEYTDYEGYFTQPAGNAFLYYCLITPFSLKGKTALNLLYLFNSVLSALVLTAFLYWVKRLWGFHIAIAVLVAILFSQWMTLFGRNLYWIFWAFYIPFISSLWYLEFRSGNRNIKQHEIFLVLYISMVVKCLFNGFEYISSVLVMAMIPFVFYGIYNKWGWNLFVKRFLTGSAGALAAVLTVMFILTVQLSFEKGTWKDGIEYIIYSFSKRSFGEGEAYSDYIAFSLKSNLTDVLSVYFYNNIWNISHWFGETFFNLFGRVQVRIIVLGLMVVSGYWLYGLNKIKTLAGEELKRKALILTLWVSISGPLSWIIIFKGHSFIHTHMNHIVWHFPFMLFAFIVIADFLKDIFITDNKKTV